MAAIGKIHRRQPARRKPAKTKSGTVRRVSPLKPGLQGARNWATAQVRAASYSRKRLVRLIITGLVLFVAIVWAALWLGGFIPNIQSATGKFTKQRLMAIGFVVDYVDVVGEGRISEADVRARLGVQPGDYLFDMDIETAQARIQSLSWVESAVIRRLWPNRVVVHINERRPYAVWQNNEIIKVVDNTGVVITDAPLAEFGTLPMVIGEGAAVHAGEIMDEINSYVGLKSKIHAIAFVGQRRWDILLKDGPRILLPSENLANALAHLDRYARVHGILDLDLERIDLRIEGRLMLKPRTEDRGRRA